MIIYSRISDTTTHIKQKRDEGSTIGFVPTMGALHEGHLELMRKAKKENDLLVVSIFVNPIQFNNQDDLKKYPRDLKKDSELLETVGCDILFAPTVDEMYPEKVTKKYDFGLLENVMEGASRPGHFNGVGVVVSKLFDICIPHKAYFGEKDYQQLAIIKKLVEIESIPVEIVPCPIVREVDGLAMSSRNERLTPNERASAPYIYEVLQDAKTTSEFLCTNRLKQYVLNQFSDRKEFEVEYFELADDKDLQPIKSHNPEKGTIGFIAVNLGKVRLIDNIRII
ncbi:MAG: pantoate--beta-alanine ligase [Bacteroidetes bacterium]|nr:pantoate--beta-alanine ligase [Bacteroidota bacterium]